MKKGFLIAAAVLAGVGLLLLAGAFAAAGFDLTNLDASNFETNTYTAGEAFASVEIRADEANIALRPSADGACSVVCVERANARHAVSVEDRTLQIVAADTRTWKDDLMLFQWKSQSVTVYLPVAAYESLTIETDTGDVAVPDEFSFADVRIAADTGEVVCGVPTSDRITIRTGTGDLWITAVQTGSMDLETSTGRIRLEAVECAETLSIRVGTGKTELENVTAKALYSTGSTGKTELENVTAKALYSIGSTGKITLKNTLVADNLFLQRSTGDVHFIACDAGQITVQTSTGDVTGAFRTEKVFVTSTSTGRVSVPASGSGGRCEITTSTGDIRITAP